MPLESPASVLYDDNGIALAVSGGIAIPLSTSALLFAGMTTSGTASVAKMSSDGTVFVTGTLTTTPVALQNVYVTNILTSSVNGAQTVNQGLSGSIGQSWYVSLTDGTQIIGSGSAAPVWVTGSVTVAFPATQSVNIVGPVTTSLSGSAVTVKELKSNTAVVTSVARVATATTIISGNLSRMGLTIHNDSAAALFVRLGPDVVTTSVFTARLSSQAYYEVPSWFTGLITGVWASGGAGNALVTEFTP